MYGPSGIYRRQGRRSIFPALLAATLVHIAVFSGWPPLLRQPDPDLHPAIRLQLQPPNPPADSQRPSPRSPGKTTPAPDQPAPAAVPTQSVPPKKFRKPAAPQPSLVARAQAPQPVPRNPYQGLSRELRPAPDTSKSARTTLEQITLVPAEKDPYRIKLATHLARELEQRNLPALKTLSRPVTMEIELQLMTNGALTRARILKPTGIRAIDESAYQASLAASPYPEPPATESMLNRFGVTLVFSPKRI